MADSEGGGLTIAGLDRRRGQSVKAMASMTIITTLREYEWKGDEDLGLLLMVLLTTGGCPIKYAFRKGVHFFRERHIFLCFYRTAQCTPFLNMYTLMPLPKTCAPFPKTPVLACLRERHINKCMPFPKNIHSSQRHICMPFPKTYFIGQPPGLLCLLTIHQTFFMRV